MRLFNKVAIIGTGLIGGSIALAIKNKRLASVVIGVSRRRQTLALAKRLGAVDIASQDLNVVRDADLIILATPVNTILRIAKIIAKFAKEGSILCDVGSSKKEIVSRLNGLFPRYVGSHPLAGSEKKGILNAHADIFKNAICILTPVESTHRQSLRKIRKLWNMLGSRVVYIEPSLHDEILSFVSHLPHFIAFCLARMTPRQYLRYTAAGFKDTTRIASSDAELWKDIFISNRKSLLNAIKVFKQCLFEMEIIVKENDAKRLLGILKQAKKIRDSLK